MGKINRAIREIAEQTIDIAASVEQMIPTGCALHAFWQGIIRDGAGIGPQTAFMCTLHQSRISPLPSSQLGCEPPTGTDGIADLRQ